MSYSSKALLSATVFSRWFPTYVSSRNGERILLVLEDVANVVLVLLVQRRDRDVVARLQSVFLDVRAHVIVARVDEVDVPLVGPVLDEVGDVVEVLEVVDEDGGRLLVAELFGHLVDEVQRQRGVFAAGPHDGGVLVLLEAQSGHFDCFLDFVL